MEEKLEEEEEEATRGSEAKGSDDGGENFERIIFFCLPSRRSAVKHRRAAVLPCCRAAVLPCCRAALLPNNPACSAAPARIIPTQSQAQSPSANH
jgi:hypothetical protein